MNLTNSELLSQNAVRARVQRSPFIDRILPNPWVIMEIMILHLTLSFIHSHSKFYKKIHTILETSITTCYHLNEI